MNIQRNNNKKNSQVFLLLVAVCLGVASGFQRHNALSPLRLATPTPVAGREPVMILNLNTPPQFDEDYDNEFDPSPQPIPAEGIPKLKLPTPKLSMPEIDFKEVLKKFGVLAGTVIAFLAIQKLGLTLSEIFTPELSAEQVRDFRL
jgi:hypothetical protein